MNFIIKDCQAGLLVWQEWLLKMLFVVGIYLEFVRLSLRHVGWSGLASWLNYGMFMFPILIIELGFLTHTFKCQGSI